MKKSAQFHFRVSSKKSLLHFTIYVLSFGLLNLQARNNETVLKRLESENRLLTNLDLLTEI